jgi:hypothetical protein
MPRVPNEKCRLCSKLSDEQAKRLHGTEGDRCWVGQPCHDRRSYYRHREAKNYRRRQQRQTQQQATEHILDGSSPVITLHVPAPAVPAAVALWYRETKTSLLHAVGAELWLGDTRAARVEPVHCLGLTESQIEALLRQFLVEFSKCAQVEIKRFRASVELNPQNCPIRPCPLHPDSRYDLLPLY